MARHTPLPALFIKSACEVCSAIGALNYYTKRDAA